MELHQERKSKIKDEGIDEIIPWIENKIINFRLYLINFAI